MTKDFWKWFKDFFTGRPLTKYDIFRDRLRLCKAVGKKPSEVKNFWEGIEDLRFKVCSNCGAQLNDKFGQKIAQALRADEVLCKKCNLRKPLF